MNRGKIPSDKRTTKIEYAHIKLDVHVLLILFSLFFFYENAMVGADLCLAGQKSRATQRTREKNE